MTKPHLEQKNKNPILHHRKNLIHHAPQVYDPFHKNFTTISPKPAILNQHKTLPQNGTSWKEVRHMSDLIKQALESKEARDKAKLSELLQETSAYAPWVDAPNATKQ